MRVVQGTEAATTAIATKRNDQPSELATPRSSLQEVFCKKVFLKISKNSQENIFIKVSFLIKLQVSAKKRP